MRRSTITALANNATAAALETTRAALFDGTVKGSPASGRPTLPGAQVTLTLAASAGETLASGDMVGYALVPASVDASGNPSTWLWARWPAADFTVVEGAPMQLKGPVDVPPGVAAVIALPLAVVDTNAAQPSTFLCGIHLHVPATVG